MNRSWIRRSALAALMLLSTTTLAFADIPSPESRNRNASKTDLKTIMRIDTDDKVKEAKLVIPRSIWQQMQAQLGGSSNPQTTAATARFFNMSSAQTIMSGIFLSLAFTTGGLWLMRSRRRAERIPARAVALTLALLLTGVVTAGVAYANAGPPPVARSLTSKILIPELQWWGAGGEVTVEIVEEGNHIKLVIPRREITDKDRRQTE
ncbi:MAG: hypothetical protein ICV60_14520 [Pyrinomonadaceae bacterium]|nr:hypothetical protein [Pyrinomonadaceae bacterium]